MAIPPHLLLELVGHLDRYVDPEPEALVFTSAEGGALRRSNFRTRVWLPATKAAGVEGLHFHDLPHTGNTLAAATGASTKELMARMGHASPRAALIYQHATADRDAAIAKALSDLVAKATKVDPKPKSKPEKLEPTIPRPAGRPHLRLVRTENDAERGHSATQGAEEMCHECAMRALEEDPETPSEPGAPPLSRDFTGGDNRTTLEPICQRRNQESPVGEPLWNLFPTCRKPSVE